MTAWNAGTAGGPVGVDAVTLVEGSSFCISAGNGDLVPHSPQGVFFGDTRILSRWNLLVNGAPVEPLGAVVREPYHAVFVGQIPHPAGHADSVLVTERDRRIGGGLREDLAITNYGPESLDCSVTLEVAADFADLFDVKGGRGSSARGGVATVWTGRDAVSECWLSSAFGLLWLLALGRGLVGPCPVEPTSSAEAILTAAIESER